MKKVEINLRSRKSSCRDSAPSQSQIWTSPSVRPSIPVAPSASDRPSAEQKSAISPPASVPPLSVFSHSLRRLSRSDRQIGGPPSKTLSAVSHRRRFTVFQFSTTLSRWSTVEDSLRCVSVQPGL